jgi:hypothetical protein
MVSIDEQGIESLKETLSQLHVRANRLYEWRALGLIFSNLDPSLNRIAEEANRPKKRSQKLKARWKDFEMKEYLEIHNFSSSQAYYITQALVPNGQGFDGFDLGIRAFASRLAQRARSISSSLASGNLDDAANEFNRLKAEIDDLKAKRNLALDYELSDLRALTFSLQGRFSWWPSEPPPGSSGLRLTSPRISGRQSTSV